MSDSLVIIDVRDGIAALYPEPKPEALARSARS